jgi:hypothetical protein
MSSYNRKYYLHRQVKKAGFRLKLETTLKIIEILPSGVERAAGNKYVAELRERYQYGCQILNPMVR